jgi:hypothetical protein
MNTGIAQDVEAAVIWRDRGAGEREVTGFFCSCYEKRKAIKMTVWQETP